MCLAYIAAGFPQIVIISSDTLSFVFNIKARTKTHTNMVRIAPPAKGPITKSCVNKRLEQIRTRILSRVCHQKHAPGIAALHEIGKHHTIVSLNIRLHTSTFSLSFEFKLFISYDRNYFEKEH